MDQVGIECEFHLVADFPGQQARTGLGFSQLNRRARDRNGATRAHVSGKRPARRCRFQPATLGE